MRTKPSHKLYEQAPSPEGMEDLLKRMKYTYGHESDHEDILDEFEAIEQDELSDDCGTLYDECSSEYDRIVDEYSKYEDQQLEETRLDALKYYKSI